MSVIHPNGYLSPSAPYLHRALDERQVIMELRARLEAQSVANHNLSVQNDKLRSEVTLYKILMWCGALAIVLWTISQLF